MRPSRAAAVLLFMYAAVVLWATLGPVPWAGSGYQSPNGVLDWELWFERATWTTGLESELMLNVLMFVPFGALLAFALRGVSFVVPAIIAAGFSLLIELVQIPLADRISDPRDLVANAGGALIGVIAARMLDAAVRLLTASSQESQVQPAVAVRASRESTRARELTGSRAGR